MAGPSSDKPSGDGLDDTLPARDDVGGSEPPAKDPPRGAVRCEVSRDRLAERHDAMVVVQAGALLESNPTEAVAVLKQLAPSSPRLADARGIAKAESMRGVAWAMQSTTAMTTMLELDPDARLRELPSIGTDFRSWLAGQTNAAVDGDSVLAWPWQAPRRP